MAWHGLGWNPVGFAEIEKFPSAVLKERFPDVTNYGDMTKFKEWENVGTVDLLVGGTPCQSFSVAGLRKGLADPRGNLMLTFGAIAHHFKARWVVWENVPGVLSSNKGRDFGSFLGMLAECGYGFAYRVLDAQFFGVPQRRRRVFVVGCLGSWLNAAKVLFDSESLSGNTPPSREKGKGVAAGVEIGPGGGHFTEISATLDTKCKDGPVRNQVGMAVLEGTRQAVCLMDQGGSVMDVEKDLSGTLRAQTHGNNPVVCIQETASRENPKSGPQGKGWKYDTAFTLDTSPVPQAVCYENHGQDSRIKDCGEVSPTISAKAGTGGGNLPLVQEFSNRPKFWDGNDYAECLTAKGADDRMPDKGRLPCVIEPDAQSPTVHLGSQVRRLTPKECERLQGFPDDWTKIPWRNKPAEQCPDGPRYKACGNSMAVPVMRWIGERINKQENDKKSR